MNCANSIVVLAAAISLVGCGTVRDQAKWDQEMARLVGAAPLDGAYAICRGATGNTCTANSTAIGREDVTSSQEARRWIAAAANDSIANCQAWMARMAVGQSGVNSLYDVTAVGLAGAAAITVPLRSAQTLAALAGITTASKAAINSDVFAQNTTPVIAQQVNATYWTSISSILDKAASATTENISSIG